MSMIRLQAAAPRTREDARTQLQLAVEVELGTLPPYLYALYSIRPGENWPAAEAIRAVAMEEMVHLCLVCNILNAIGGDPTIAPMTYPNPLPGSIGHDDEQLVLHLLRFSPDAMKQAMDIEQPVTPIDIPDAALDEVSDVVTIGQFYTRLDACLAGLPEEDWTPGRNQVWDTQFLQGQIFPVHNYKDAHKAIEQIISEGEGTDRGTEQKPLDFKGEVAHFYRFSELYRDQVLTKAENEVGYAWGGPFGVDWNAVHRAIDDPGKHDFSGEPAAAQEAQRACDRAYADMVTSLQQAVRGRDGALGVAARAMFDLRMAAQHAFTVHLADGEHVAGPAFVYHPPTDGESR